MAYFKESQKKYRSKKKNFTLSYNPTDIKDALRLEAYLNTIDISCNAYLKRIVKADLDSKGIGYPDSEGNDVE